MTPDHAPTPTLLALLAATLLMAPASTAASGDYFTVDHPGELTTTRHERVCATQPINGTAMSYEWFTDQTATTNLSHTRTVDSEGCAWFGSDRAENQTWLRLSYKTNTTNVHGTYHFSPNGTLTQQTGTVDLLDGHTGTLIFVTLTILSFFHGWLIAGTFAFAAGIGTLVTDPTYLTVTLGFGGVLIGTIIEVLGHKWKPIKRTREWVRES